jgi:hypothetical protein
LVASKADRRLSTTPAWPSTARPVALDMVLDLVILDLAGVPPTCKSFYGLVIA